MGAVLSFGFSSSTWADYTLNMTKGVSPVSARIYDLHMIIFGICTIIAILVYSIMIYSIIRHRKSRGYKAAEFHESTTVEIIWTIIPFFILIAMAIPATSTLFDMEDVSDSDLTIKVTGYRWYWHYDYLDEDISFFSRLTTPDDQVYNLVPKGEHYLLEVDNNLVVPVGKKIRFLIGSKDVIHSWWVPAFGVKKDAIPGFIRQIWTQIDVDKPGIYRGQCAELCGAKHGYMPIVVEAKPYDEYVKWVEEQKQKQAAASADEDKEWSYDELMVKGEKEYNTVCAMCHQASGKGLPPTFPSLVDSPIVRTPDQRINHIKNVLYGKNAMPAFGEQLSDVQIAAIITYERNAWGHETKEMVQPQEVKEQRQKG
ncbi:MAG: cytochrome c oxidase subunit II [Candidatus Berkiella sp.]